MSARVWYNSENKIIERLFMASNLELFMKNIGIPYLSPFVGGMTVSLAAGEVINEMPTIISTTLNTPKMKIARFAASTVLCVVYPEVSKIAGMRVAPILLPFLAARAIYKSGIVPQVKNIVVEQLSAGMNNALNHPKLLVMAPLTALGFSEFMGCKVSTSIIHYSSNALHGISNALGKGWDLTKTLYSLTDYLPFRMASNKGLDNGIYSATGSLINKILNIGNIPSDMMKGWYEFKTILSSNHFGPIKPIKAAGFIAGKLFWCESLMGSAVNIGINFALPSVAYGSVAGTAKNIDGLVGELSEYSNLIRKKIVVDRFKNPVGGNPHISQRELIDKIANDADYKQIQTLIGDLRAHTPNLTIDRLMMASCTASTFVPHLNFVATPLALGSMAKMFYTNSGASVSLVQAARTFRDITETRPLVNNWIETDFAQAVQDRRNNDVAQLTV